VSTLLNSMLARVNKTPQDLAKNSKAGKIFKRQGVADSAELNRIVNLPRRDWRERTSIHLELTNWLRKPVGKMILREVQAAALTELHDFGGLIASITVGGGKTLISLLAQEIVEAKRPLLLIPAKLKRKTEMEISKYAAHWRFTKPAIVSYEWLGRVQADDIKDDAGKVIKAGFLRKYGPDLIIADECHKLRNTGASVTRRIGRHMTANPTTRFLGMSGTITKRSIVDYAHLMEWALKKNAPIPLIWPVLREWADALDEGMDNRLAPGALLRLATQEEILKIQQNALPELRKVFKRRLTETPGVVATEESFVDCSLQLTGVEPEVGVATEEAFATLIRDWATPDGQPIPDPVSLWRHTRELACGFFYKWDPAGPLDWMIARRAWCKFVRETIKKTELDSELQVAQAIYRKQLKDLPFIVEASQFSDSYESGTIYANWAAIRETFKPNTVPVWFDESVVDYAADWMQKNKGIVWVEHVCFGERLAEVTGRPFFQRKGEDGRGNLIDETKPADGSIIASVASNAEGRNLQVWSQNLVVSPPPTGSVWEQLLGREHRSGQMADEVSFEVIVHCLGQWRDFMKALDDAKYINDSTGQLQKLTYASVDVMDGKEVARRAGVRWVSPSIKT